MFNSEQLGAIVRLTEAHDQSALISAFLDMLRDLKLADKSKYYEIYNPSRDREFGGNNLNQALVRDPLDPTFVATHVNEDSDWIKAVKKLEIVRKPSADGHIGSYIVPVLGNLRAIGLLILEDQEHSREEWDFFCALVDIFGNLMSLVRKKERDALTGLLNRLVFEERLHQMLNYTMSADRRTSDQPLNLCMAMVDIDKFKSVNDDFGHLYGDEVLVHFTQIMTRSFRYFDLLCRYGGEEFAIVLRNVDMDQALEVLERFRQDVEGYDFPQVGTKTCSIGAVQIYPGEILTSIVDKADKALYYGKTHGRNQVHSYERLVADGVLEPQKVSGGDIEMF